MAADLPDDFRRLLVDLEGARGCISGDVIDYRMPCTATEDTTCQIVHHLPVWNEFLRSIRLELIELTESGRQLGLVGVPEFDDFDKTDKERDQASTLLYWLLQTHRCVASLFVTATMIHGRSSENRRDLLWKALDGNASLKSLTFEDSLDQWRQQDEEQESADFCKALLSLSSLEEFDPDVAEWDGLLSAMCTILRSTTKLRVLNLFRTGLHFGCEALLWALRANSTLRHLSLPTHMISEHPYSFLKFMAASATLQRLSVLYEPRLDNKNALRWVFKGMLKNPAISVLEVEDCRLDSGSTRMAARMLRENRNLISLKLSWNRFLNPNDPPLLGTPADVALLHDALSQNSTLEYLTLCLHVWSVDQWRPFFSVLSTHGSLKMVTINAADELYCLMHGVVQELELSGTEQKVCFQATCSMKSLLASDCRRCSSLKVCVTHYPYGRRDYNGGILLPVLQQLPTLSHLTVSSIPLERVCSAKFSAITDYIATTSTLKNLSLQYEECYQEAGPSLCSLLSQSLLLNTSITELGIGNSGDPCDGLALLGDVVRQSVVIRRIRFLSWHWEAFGLFVRRLLVDVSRYDALCGVAWWDPSLNRSINSWVIMCTARRNSGFVARAVQFLNHARCDGHCAAGLERVYRHPALLAELAEVLSIEVAEARQRVRQRFRSIEGLQDFMRLAGVVKERVTCLPSEDGSTQLDALNDHCWSHVRRYLQLDDVVLGSTSPAQ